MNAKDISSREMLEAITISRSTDCFWCIFGMVKAAVIEDC
jgi:hypothetical protein